MLRITEDFRVGHAHPLRPALSALPRGRNFGFLPQRAPNSTMFAYSDVFTTQTAPEPSRISKLDVYSPVARGAMASAAVLMASARRLRIGLAPLLAYSSSICVFISTRLLRLPRRLM